MMDIDTYKINKIYVKNHEGNAGSTVSVVFLNIVPLLRDWPTSIHGSARPGNGILRPVNVS